MNGKKARLMRRIAHNLTLEKPDKEYNTQPVPSQRSKVAERTELVDECTRALYKDMKKGYIKKHGKIAS